MLKDNAEERGEAPLEIESPQPGDDRIYGQPWRAKLRVRAPSAPETPPAQRQPSILSHAAEKGRPETGSGPRWKSTIRRRPMASAIAMLLLASVPAAAASTWIEHSWTPVAISWAAVPLLFLLRTIKPGKAALLGH